MTQNNDQAFKIGDKVQINLPRGGSGHRYYDQGQIGLIVKITKNQDFYYDDDSPITIWYYLDINSNAWRAEDLHLIERKDEGKIAQKGESVKYLGEPAMVSDVNITYLLEGHGKVSHKVCNHLNVEEMEVCREALRQKKIRELQHEIYNCENAAEKAKQRLENFINGIEIDEDY